MNLDIDLVNSLIMLGMVLTSLAGVIHIWAIFRGARAYRQLGAGEKFAQMAENGAVYPAVLTSLVALFLFGCSAYAAAAVGWLNALPYQREAIAIVSVIFTLRGMGGVLLPIFIKTPYVVAMGKRFWLLTSGYCLLTGFCYCLALLQR